MKSAEIAARYSFSPNSYGYCGTTAFSNTLKEEGSLEKELEKFHPHYAYLSLIARENGMKPFDMEVVRAFWTGNRLLEIPADSIRSFIVRDLLADQPERAKILADNLPEGLLPHHSFNALYIKFVTDKVQKSLKNFDLCCVTAGKVLSVSGKSAVVDRFTIEKDGLGQKTDTVELERMGLRFVDPEEGDLVSVHWGMVIEKLTREDIANLKSYTKRNIDILNLH